MSNVCSDIVSQNVSTGHGNVETSFVSDTATRIDDSDDEVLVMETLEVKPIEVGDDAPSNVNPNEIDGATIATIATQNSSDANNPNDG